MHHQNHSLVIFLTWAFLLYHLACAQVINPQLRCVDPYGPATIDLQDCHYILSKFPVNHFDPTIRRQHLRQTTSLPLLAPFYRNPARFKYRTCLINVILSNPLASTEDPRLVPFRTGALAPHFPADLSDADMTRVWPFLQAQATTVVRQCVIPHQHRGVAWGQLLVPRVAYSTHRIIAYRVSVGTPETENSLHLPEYDLERPDGFYARFPDGHGPEAHVLRVPPRKKARGLEGGEGGEH